MSFARQYQRFLTTPTADALAENASINYITTLTTFNEPLAILKHLVAQGKQLQKKSEKIISTIDSGNALCLDVETTIQFVSGGGAYLPGLDDNFLADRVAIFPVVHIVHFDENGKILQIRQYWDQASLLKQIEVMGARGNSWPIRDGKDMVRLIATNASAVPSAGGSRPSTSSSQDPNAVTISHRPSSRHSTRSNSASATGDPHATLSLFQPIEEEESVPSGRGVATRASAKPAPRDIGELFVNDSTAENVHKNNIPSKAGASKKWGANRLFDEEETAGSPDKTSIKTEPLRYNHFEFGNGEDTPKADRTVNLKHQSQWGFEDFVTPQKYAPKTRGQDVRNFGWSDDEPEQSPVRKPVVHQPRRDAASQFEFQDDGTPEGHKLLPKNNKGKIQNAGMALYKDNVLGDESDEAQGASQKKPLGNVTAQYNNESRKKTFGSQWESTDDSPSTKPNPSSEQPIRSAPENIKKVAKSTDSHWSLYDESPKSKENVPTKIYKTAGNGMGGRSDAKLQWGFGDEADEAFDAVETENRGRKPAQQQSNKPVEKSFWDF